MKKVENETYLYLRGDIYYFRRAVPRDALVAFGTDEDVVSLKTKDLAEARHARNRELVRFEQVVADVRNVVPPAKRISNAAVPPTSDEIEMAVRKWLKSLNDRRAERELHYAPEQERDRLIATEGEQEFLSNASQGRWSLPPLSTEWIAEAISEEQGWRLPADGHHYRTLTRLIMRGLIEANERSRQHILGEPLRTLDERFGPDRYEADALKPAARKPQSLSAFARGLRSRTSAQTSDRKGISPRFYAICAIRRPRQCA